MAFTSRMTRPIRLILDFDGTVTTKDTLHLVAKVGYDRQSATLNVPAPTPWEEIVNAYLRDFSNHQSNYRPARSDRKTLHDEVSWLNSLKPIETASAARFKAADVFDGVTQKHLIEAAQKAVQNKDVELRPGLYDLLKQVYHHNASIETNDRSERLQVLSVNWSRQFVWSVIEAAAPTDNDIESQHQLTEVLSSISVYANEVQSTPDENDASVSPKGEATVLRTSGDKLEQMLRSQSKVTDPAQDPLNIYVGDSATDFECLVAADVGICVRDEPVGSSQTDLAETFGRLDVSVEHINLCRDVVSSPAKNRSSASKKDLWWAKNFIDINRWLEGVVGS